MGYVYDYPRPAVTVDVVAIAVTAGGPRVLLIERRSEPFAGCFALPGGFVDIDEDLEPAARRELAEETALDVGPLLEIGAFGAVHRDPRGRSIGVAFAALSIGEPPHAVAGDDARRAVWRGLGRLPKLAFDHRDIVAAARRRIAERIRLDGSPAALLAGEFTADDLCRAAEPFDGCPGSPSTLARRLVALGTIRPTGRRRGRAALYRSTSRRHR